MLREQMETKVKEFVNRQLESAKEFCKTPAEVRQTRAIAFGATFFASNNCFSEYNKELADWWDNEMLEEFRKVEASK